MLEYSKWHLGGSCRDIMGKEKEPLQCILAWVTRENEQDGLLLVVALHLPALVSGPGYRILL